MYVANMYLVIKTLEMNNALITSLRVQIWWEECMLQTIFVKHPGKCYIKATSSMFPAAQEEKL